MAKVSSQAIFSIDSLELIKLGELTQCPHGRYGISYFWFGKSNRSVDATEFIDRVSKIVPIKPVDIMYGCRRCNEGE